MCHDEPMSYFNQNRGYHWRYAKNARLRELAEWEAYKCYPEMMDAEREHDGTIEVVFGSQGAALTLGVIDAEASVLFSHGHCAILAWEIHVKTGLPLAVFTSENDRLGWSGHVALQLAEDTFLDIEGVETLEAIKRRYPSIKQEHELLSDDEFKKLIVDEKDWENPKQYLCELEQLVLTEFVDLVIEENKEAIALAQEAVTVS
jgi:hypothetical protein